MVSLAVAGAFQAGIFAALVVGLIGAALVGAFAEARLTGIISSIDRIARGVEAREATRRTSLRSYSRPSRGADG